MAAAENLRTGRKSQLQVSIGQCSDAGRKPRNQDFHGLCIPHEPQLSSKGIAIALADGISSSDVSHIASETAVAAFLSDYFSTSEAWSVKTSVTRVLSATNAWLHAQTRRGQHRYDMDRGYVCTFSALVLKSTTAHLFHVGDTRIYRLRDGSLEPLTRDHRVWVGEGKSYLSHALGIQPQLEIDYQALAIESGDLFLLATDGVYEFADARFMIDCIAEHIDDLQLAAQRIVDGALANGSDDNLTLQLVRVDSLPRAEADELQHKLGELPCPPILEARMRFDGYRIVRPLHASARSHVYLATDEDSGATVVIKTPSLDLQHDAAYLERFLMEEWIARRIDSPHVLKACTPTRKRNFLYGVSEFIEGQTLAQWMIDHPRPDLETVRGIVEQIARGLRAFHRLEMLHQDLRPANLMIDATGTVKIIDFGATRVAGLQEIDSRQADDPILGTAQYSAPEYWLGEPGTVRSDVFSLAVIAYQMLAGRLPYGAGMARARTRAAQARLRYAPLGQPERKLPLWLDDVLRKACHPDPLKRYDDPDEFAHALRHPGRSMLGRGRVPLLEQNPLLFWQISCAALALTVVILLARG
ncbi:bifunctional protein-serine/threonine kinase/phosphatase [Phytopseudomonas punonensis]|uniref:Serine/threonine protein phosphatase PrpC n=1 Tax=Phytopseudomonas punonensis TaxID=1220495 RepID=A0A1M6YVA5_9GAMM|nr:bifunctional protein-serine/threonine kinase/phosphatase [Pseudomonas punonensis]SHL22254.1 Serine/threonine protein phosphatase PrpC [Pseudomonas punonensis]